MKLQNLGNWLQMLASESRRTSDLELQYIGERGAEVWAKALERPLEIDGAEWRHRVNIESSYYYSHPHGIAWWENFKATAAPGEIPGELMALMDQVIYEDPDFHRRYNRGGNGPAAGATARTVTTRTAYSSIVSRRTSWASLSISQ